VGELFYLTGQTVHIPSVRCTLREPKDLASPTIENLRHSIQKSYQPVIPG